MSAEGCGVTVEGSSVATPPVADTKASSFLADSLPSLFVKKVVGDFKF